MEDIKKLNKNEIIDRILDSYFASDQVYPDKYTLIYFTSARALNDKAFSDYCAGSEERRLKYEAYLNTLEERKKLFEERVEKLALYLSTNPITTYDIELITGVSLDSFKNAIAKKNMYEKYSKRFTTSLVSICNSANNHALSLEEALKIKYAINGIELTLDGIKSIYSFLKHNNMTTSLQNIIYAFERKIEEENKQKEEIPKLAIKK